MNQCAYVDILRDIPIVIHGRIFFLPSKGHLCGVALDMMAVTFILLPLYGNLVDGYIYSVNLLSFTDTTPIYLAIYWIVFIVLIALGIAKLMCVCFEKESWSNIITKCSLVLSTLFICFFAAARQPYVTVLMFLLFVAKIFVWIKQTQTK